MPRQGRPLAKKLPQKLLKMLAALAATVLVSALVTGLRPVHDEEMAFSLRPGDWVLLLPLTPTPGDVVRLQDPLDPHRTILRRLLATGGTEVAFTGATAVIDGRANRHLEMFRDLDTVVLEEAGAALLTLGGKVVLGDVSPVTVPPGQVFLAADHRDQAMDSRHWGPLPLSSLGWVAVLRIGPPNAWQGVVSKP